MYPFLATILSPLFSNRLSLVSFQCFTLMQSDKIIMTGSSDGESVGSDCGQSGKDKDHGS